MQVVKVVHNVWADFKEKTRDHIVPHFDTTALAAQVGRNIFLVSWDKILLLAMEIADIIDLERNKKPDVGVFAFAKKKAELLRIAAYVFMFGTDWVRDTRRCKRCFHWYRPLLLTSLPNRRPMRSGAPSSSCMGAHTGHRAWT